MKTCVSSYSFQPLLKSGELNQLELISKVKEMGFDAAGSMQSSSAAPRITQSF